MISDVVTSGFAQTSQRNGFFVGRDLKKSITDDSGGQHLLKIAQLLKASSATSRSEDEGGRVPEIKKEHPEKTRGPIAGIPSGKEGKDFREGHPLNSPLFILVHPTGKGDNAVRDVHSKKHPSPYSVNPLGNGGNLSKEQHPEKQFR